jgi:RNA polymerase sigma-70 factor, ECF subfamily
VPFPDDVAGSCGGGPGRCTGGPVDVEAAYAAGAFGPAGVGRDAALAALHARLLRIAGTEVRRRTSSIVGPELDDIAHQSADDALVAITAKLEQFRGESRFTTWAYGFVILEVSAKLGRHFWRHPSVALDADGWNRLPDRFGLQPEEHAVGSDLMLAARRAIEEDLTERQRQVFTAIAINGIPVDALAEKLGSSRNALYKTMFDARRKLRAVLAEHGYVGAEQVGDERTVGRS